MLYIGTKIFSATVYAANLSVAEFGGEDDREGLG
jgi:hypothetical protein